MEVEITRIKRVRTGKVKAYLDIRLFRKITIKNCKILSSDAGEYLSLPTQKGKDENMYPVVRFESKEEFEDFKNQVFEILNQ